MSPLPRLALAVGSLALPVLVACGTPADAPSPGTTGTGGTAATGGTGGEVGGAGGLATGGAGGGGAGGSGGSGGEPDPHPIGMSIPPFALEDLNPNSATYGQQVDSEELAGAPYALVFLDSRCVACPKVADDLWAAYQEHASWWAAQPTFGVERAKALETAPETVAAVVEGNGLPYLADTYETDLWLNLGMLNHDFIAVSAEGTLTAWLPMYEWPDDLQMFLDHMTERYGE